MFRLKSNIPGNVALGCVGQETQLRANLITISVVIERKDEMVSCVPSLCKRQDSV